MAQRASAKDTFVELTEDVRDEVLNLQIEDWMVYIHPEQLHLAHRQFAGPARIHGPSGTGKSVVALHRAAHLARSGRKVLFTSFVASLPKVQAQLFRRLAPASSDLVEFDHIQSIARAILERAGSVATANSSCLLYTSPSPRDS